MDKQNLMPQVAQPVNRTTSGQLSPELAELSEEALQQHDSCGGGDDAAVFASNKGCHWENTGGYACSYDGDDAE